MTDPATPKPLLGEPLYDLAGHPEYAQLVGQIAATWTVVEFQLCTLFTALCRAVPQRAQAAFYALVNNSARIDMLRAIAKDKTLSKDDRKSIEKLIERVRDAASKRNSYVHKLWLLKDGKIYISENTGFDFPHGQKRLVHKSELEAALKFTRETAEVVTRFNIDFTARDPIPWANRHLHRSLLKKPPTPPPHPAR